MVNSDYTHQNCLNKGQSISPPSSHRPEDKLNESSGQPSYWKFLAEKIPMELELSNGCETVIQEEESECEELSPQETFARKIQSIDAVLHIVADNHKSHETAQRRHSAPSSAKFLTSSVSAPVLVRKSSKNRWETTASPSTNVKHSPKVPSRFDRSGDPSRCAPTSNASWSARSNSSAHTVSHPSFASADSSRLESLGLSDLRSSNHTASFSQTQQKAPGTKQPCRWSIPTNNSDSLLIYPQRGREPPS